MHNSRRKQRVEARAESLSDSDEQPAQRPAPAEPPGLVKAEPPASGARGSGGWGPSAELSQQPAGADMSAMAAPPPRRARTARAKAAASREALEEQARA